jgi:NAD(P)-dependent dehydrogenase (short-subunit alcohol dehydrogenase family)
LIKLKNKVVVITGAGRGIGQAVALACAREGADLLVCSRTEPEFMETARQIRALGRKVVPLRVDVSKVDDVEKMTATAIREMGKIDVLVNSAGIIGPIGPFIGNEFDKWFETIKVNLVGTALCCKSVIPFMIKHSKGKIINFSGGGASSPRSNFSAYAASKSGVVGFTASLAEEVKAYNIQVNALSPGAIYSRMHDQVLEVGLKAGEKELALSKRVKKNNSEFLIKAVDCAVFLASDESDGLTGRLISAMWDDWRKINPERLAEIASSDLYTLRRIDNVLYCKIN